MVYNKSNHHTPHTPLQRINKVSTIGNLETWHQRMGHPSAQALWNTQHVVQGIPKLPSNTSYFHCPFCDIAKIKKAPQHKMTDRDNFKPGTAYHMDLGYIGGPSKDSKKIECRSYEGFVTYLLIIDAASRYTFVFPLKSKHPPIKLIDEFLTKHGHSNKNISTSQHGTLAKSK